MFEAQRNPEPQKLPSARAADQNGEAWYCTATSSRFPAHHHDELELTVVARGSVGYRVEGRDYEARAGSVLWLHPHAVHDLVCCSPDLAMWVFMIREQLLEKACAAHPALLTSALGPADLCSCDPDAFASLSAKGSAIVRHRSTVVTNRLISELLPVAAQALQGRNGRRFLHPAVRRVVQQIDSFEADLSLPSLASRCRLSEEHLSRLFAHDMGVPLVYYRNHQRVQALVRSYGTKRDNLLKSAMDAGFGSYAQFSRSFCQVTAQSPREHFHWLDRKRQLA